jgi:hypothetical protein
MPVESKYGDESERYLIAANFEREVCIASHWDGKDLRLNWQYAVENLAFSIRMQNLTTQWLYRLEIAVYQEVLLHKLLEAEAYF